MLGGCGAQCGADWQHEACCICFASLQFASTLKQCRGTPRVSVLISHIVKSNQLVLHVRQAVALQKVTREFTAPEYLLILEESSCINEYSVHMYINRPFFRQGRNDSFVASAVFLVFGIVSILTTKGRILQWCYDAIT